jgi:hypothetical protein
MPVVEQSSLAKTSKGSSDLLFFIHCKFEIKPRDSGGLFLRLDGEVTIGAVATIDESTSQGTTGVADSAVIINGA